MGAARSWAVMAITGPVLTGLLVLAQSGPGRAFLFDVAYCNWGIGRHAQALFAAALGVLSLAIALTFVTDALRRQGLSLPARVLWSMALLCASPVAVPTYWLLYLREPA